MSYGRALYVGMHWHRMYGTCMIALDYWLMHDILEILFVVLAIWCAIHGLTYANAWEKIVNDQLSCCKVDLDWWMCMLEKLAEFGK